MKKILVVRESLSQSIFSDLITFGAVTAMFWFNYTYMNNMSTFRIFIIVVFIIMSFGVFSKRKKVIEVTEEELRQYIALENKVQSSNEAQIFNESQSSKIKLLMDQKFEILLNLQNLISTVDNSGVKDKFHNHNVNLKPSTLCSYCNIKKNTQKYAEICMNEQLQIMEAKGKGNEK